MILWWDANAGVGYADLDEPVQWPGADDDRTSGRAVIGLPGHQVVEYLGQVRMIPPDARQVGRDLLFQPEVLFAHLLLKAGAHLLDHNLDGQKLHVELHRA